jgi:hypothetical protein
MAPVRTILAALVAVVLVGPALAQPTINMAPQDKYVSPEELEKQREIDRAYKEAIKKLPDQQRNNDPWASVRGVDQSAQKPAAPKATAAKPARPKNADVKTQAVR